MKVYFRKTAVCILALSLLVAVIVSCSAKEELLPFITQSGSDAPDFAGYEFVLKTAWTIYWDPNTRDDSSAAFTVRDDAVIKHNAMISEKYNCSIKTIATDWDFAKDLAADIAVGSTKYDLIDSATRFSGSAAKGGFLIPWEYTGINLTDYDKYGPEQYLNAAVFDGLHYGIWCNYWDVEIEYRGMLAVNNNLLKKYSDKNVHEMYENGEWTFDGFKALLSVCGNMDTEGSEYPLTCYDSNILALCSVLANGGNLVDYDETTGKYKFGLTEENALKGLEYAQSLCSEKLAYIDTIDMDKFDTQLTSVFGLCESWNLKYMMMTVDNMDVITFPYGPDAEYGKTCSAFRTNLSRYISMPITSDADLVGDFIDVWFSELEDAPKASLLSQFKSIMFFNDESYNAERFMADNATYDYGAAINDIYDSFVSGLGSTVTSSNASITEYLSSHKDSVQNEIDKALN